MIVQDINLHPSSDMLLKYSMGNTTEAESLIISCHIAYCSECKNEIKKYETIGGYYLSNHKELSVSKDLWKNILKEVDGLEQEEHQTNYTSHSIKSNLSDIDIKIPSTLSGYLGSDFNTNDWKSTINNVRYKDINFQDKNISGKLLDLDAEPDAYAKIIVSWVKNQDLYNKLVLGARRHYEENGNWELLINRFIHEIKQIVQH